MNKVLEEIRHNGIVPVLKFQNVASAVPTCQAIRRGGLNVAEITFRTDAAEESIKAVSHALPDMLVGAGTVTNIDQAERAIAAGASFIVTPGLNPHVVGWCVEHEVAIIPGVNDPSGIELAMGYGLRCLKFFPAEATGGVNFLKAIRGPYSEISFVPTGGVSEENLSNYLSTPGVVACGGSWLVPDAAIESGDFTTIETLVRKAVRKMLDFKLAHVGVNTNNESEALAAANQFGYLFGFETNVGNSSIVAGTAVEFMKRPYLGKSGHIGIRTSDVERAKYFLSRAGFDFLENTAKFDSKGTLKAIYLSEEIAGFAIHLVK